MFSYHYSDAIMSAMASKFAGVTIVYTTVCSGADQRKHQSSAPLAFMRGIHRWPVNSPHKGPVTRKMFPFDDVIMIAITPQQSRMGPPHAKCHNSFLIKKHMYISGTTNYFQVEIWLEYWKLPPKWQNLLYRLFWFTTNLMALSITMTS